MDCFIAASLNLERDSFDVPDDDSGLRKYDVSFVLNPKRDLESGAFNPEQFSQNFNGRI
jgi:hypothetical protein